MGGFENYTEEALKRSGSIIENYERQELDGAIVIKYNLVEKANAIAGGALGTLFGNASLGTFMPNAVNFVSCIAASILGFFTGAAIFSNIKSCTTRYHYFDIRSRELIGNSRNEASQTLDSIGCRLFSERNYFEAAEYHKNAYQLCCSSDSATKQKIKKNENRAIIEACAMTLNDQGDNLFKQGNYTEAQRKYLKAFEKSEVNNQRNKFEANIDRAQTEIHATNLNAEGDHLFNQGNYIEAQRLFQEASEKSQIEKQHNKYLFNRNRAQVEATAVKLNAEGNELFNQNKYEEALIKYRAAQDTSKVTNQRNIYTANRDRAQNIKNKLATLDNLWDKAWNTEYEQPNKAERMFKNILNKSKDALAIFPDNLRFKQYEIIASLKIEGDELFNQGSKMDHKGLKILNSVQELKNQQKYECVEKLLNKAYCKFRLAKLKYETGNKYDQRFASCVEFVQNHIKEVEQSINIQNSLLPHDYHHVNAHFSVPNVTDNIMNQ